MKRRFGVRFSDSSIGFLLPNSLKITAIVVVKLTYFINLQPKRPATFLIRISSARECTVTLSDPITCIIRAFGTAEALVTRLESCVFKRPVSTNIKTSLYRHTRAVLAVATEEIAGGVVATFVGAFSEIW